VFVDKAELRLSATQMMNPGLFKALLIFDVFAKSWYGNCLGLSATAF